MMKAVQINEYGDASTVQIVDIDQPRPTETQVLVEVHASSLNPFDTTIRAGYMKELITLDFPVTLGGDIAGVVTELGSQVSSLTVGDKVYGQANVVAGNSGAFAEFAATKAGQIARMPRNLDFQQAAAMPLVGVSALQALSQHINLQSGQKIFIHGGAGGIGTVAIQIAKNIGAYVATTATGEGIDYVKKLGADEVIDYKTQNFAAELSDIDAVFDTVGGDDFSKSFKVLKKGGVAVSMIAPTDEAKAAELGITAFTQSTQVTTAKLDELTGLIETDVVTPHIDKVFPLADIQQAFEAREKGTVRGKVVLSVQ
jgi:NADPH:quinone reductase-like Zn-dependent oxidoreductase